MDDAEVAKFWGKPPLGTLSPSCRCLIGITTLATLLVAYLSWHLIWDLYGCEFHFYAFWVRNGVWLGIALCALAAFIPRSSVSRFIRLATLLPLIHLAAAIASVALWLYVSGHARKYDGFGDMMVLPAHTWTTIAVGILALAASAWLIRRREWLQTLLVLTLSFLLLLGAWLPYSAVDWFLYTRRDLGATLSAPETFLVRAILPALLVALAFTTLVMRWPQAANHKRAYTIVFVSFLLVIACIGQLKPSDRSTVLYLNAVWLVLMAQGLAIVTLVIVSIAMWLGTRRARVQLRAIRSERGTIADPDGNREPVVELEIAGWLRSPRIATYPFEVITSGDRVPVGGAPVLWDVPTGTTRLATGERCPVLRRGDAVAIFLRDTAATGHPFRSARNIDVLAVSESDTGAGFTSMTLMLWRPATAYMAIALAVMIPAALALIAT